jgi:hypothetical protein
MTNVLESLIGEYISEQKEREIVQRDIDTNSSLITLLVQREKINKEIEKILIPYKDNLNTINSSMDNILKLVDENWNQEGKSYKCNTRIATIRTIKSLKIINKDELVDFLTRNNILNKNIKTFDMLQLRKIKDSGLLEDDIAKWDEKKSFNIKQKPIK